VKSEGEDTNKSGDHSSKRKTQAPKHSEPKHSDDKQNQSDDKNNETIASERYPEEQVNDPDEFPEINNKRYNDKSDRV
jgi:hypothetical protein